MNLNLQNKFFKIIFENISFFIFNFSYFIFWKKSKSTKKWYNINKYYIPKYIQIKNKNLNFKLKQEIFIIIFFQTKLKKTNFNI